jgi:hypothetical protein
MRRLLSCLLLLTWSCWFGGTIALFVFVQSLFARYPKSVSMTAVEGAPVLFNTFGKMQLVLAAVSLLLTFLWRLKSRRADVTVIFSLLGGASVGAVALGAWVVPKMNALRAAGETTGKTWGMLHGVSSSIYLAEAALLLAAGVLILIATYRDGANAREASDPSSRGAA